MSLCSSSAATFVDAAVLANFDADAAVVVVFCAEVDGGRRSDSIADAGRGLTLSSLIADDLMVSM